MSIAKTSFLCRGFLKIIGLSSEWVPSIIGHQKFCGTSL